MDVSNFRFGLSSNRSRFIHVQHIYVYLPDMVVLRESSSSKFFVGRRAEHKIRLQTVSGQQMTACLKIDMLVKFAKYYEIVKKVRNSRWSYHWCYRAMEEAILFPHAQRNDEGLWWISCQGLQWHVVINSLLIADLASSTWRGFRNNWPRLRNNSLPDV